MNRVAENEVVVLTGPVHSGKSLALLEWAADKRLAGFITPTFFGKKKLLNVATRERTDFEVSCDDANAVRIGNYCLSAVAFAEAAQMLNKAVTTNQDWILIDEIGKLELKEVGHHAAFVNMLANYAGRLLLVVRDTLLQEVLRKYELCKARVIAATQLNEIE